ncbi:MAG: DUF5696 domain-containing protein [Clostridia bacterium]|nr:DUF5696 domain-containing protein [Clostridia bacterium]
MKKLLSIILAVMFIVSAFSLTVSAKESAAESTDEVFYKYYTTEYKTQQSKVDTMTKMFSNDEYEMYFDTKSGEFAIKTLATGEYVFSNPYDIAVTSSTTETTESESSSETANLDKNALLSQVLIEYTDTTTGIASYLSSFGSAAIDSQITFKKLTNGIRVEYAIGTVETKRLVPIYIEKSRFQTMIVDVLEAQTKNMSASELLTYTRMTDGTIYQLYDQTDPNRESVINDWREAFSCLEHDHEMVIYVFQGTERSKSQVEKLIRKYCPLYTYDELEYDHDLTEYEGTEKEPPLFRLAVEYTFDENGFIASIPSKSIRYNSTNYTLNTIVLLPYFGCTTTKTTGATSRNGGYIFIPDGSGTLLEYYKADGTVKTGRQSTGTVYGLDFAKESISETGANSKNALIPVFGLTEQYTETVTSSRTNRPDKSETFDHARGFVAIITEGESFANIVADLGQMAWSGLSTTKTCDYNTVYAAFAASQNDEVKMGSSLGSAQSMSTTIDTKYTGNYSIRYVMLTDRTVEGKKTYEPTYIGMADAYRAYLISIGAIDRLTSAEIESGIPLYIQSFGAVKAASTFMTFPVTVTTPLTTFADVQTMSELLFNDGITNQRFVLTAFGNGTLEVRDTKYPTYVNWQSKCGGKSGLRKLLSYCEDNGVLIFPNYDFMNVSDYKFGTFSYRKYVAETMSGVYAIKREYDPIYQAFLPEGWANIISSGALAKIYEKFSKQYNKYDIGSLAALTLGTDLSSDFNDEAPITRADSEDYVRNLLAAMREDNGSLLVSGGNSYTFPYVTDIIELPLDNSGYSISSNTVPFLGLVLHGYVNYAGDAINMQGDSNYFILKSIENGAGLYYVISYQNVGVLKNSESSDYYSVSFDTLYPDVVADYNELNSVIGNLQDATIVSHTFPTAYRMDKSTASVIFGLDAQFKSDRATTRATNFEIMARVDELIKNQQNADAEIVKETAATVAYNEATARYSLVESFASRYSVSNVVSVTYEKPDGTRKTFYINYNTFDVVVSDENGIFTVEAESYIDIDTAAKSDVKTYDYTEITAYTYTAKQLSAFNTALAEYRAALEKGNAQNITRKKNALDTAIQAMTPANDVISVSDTDGDVIVNYNKAGVIAVTGEYEFVQIASQGYATVKD